MTTAQNLPPASFQTLVAFLASQALGALGQIPELSKQPGFSPQPAVAKHLIDSLEVLQQKTDGNLSSEEASQLASLISQLRIVYVQTQAGGK